MQETPPSISSRRCCTPSGRWYNRSSKVGDTPFYDAEQFPWVKTLETNWHVIRQELDAVMASRDHLPNFQDISPDQKGFSQDEGWKTYFFYAYGIKANSRPSAARKPSSSSTKFPA